MKEIQSKFIIFQDLKTDRSKINIHGGNCDFLQISFITLNAGLHRVWPKAGNFKKPTASLRTTKSDDKTFLALNFNIAKF